MTGIEIAARLWKTEYESASFDDHPGVWVGHFADDEMLGTVRGATNREGNLVLCLAAPFAVCHEISDTFVFLDRPGHALVTRIAERGSGVQITDWKLPYSFDGTVQFTPVKEWHPVGPVRAACDEIAHRRLTGRTYPFLEAFEASIRWGRQL